MLVRQLANVTIEKLNCLVLRRMADFIENVPFDVFLWIFRHFEE